MIIDIGENITRMLVVFIWAWLAKCVLKALVETMVTEALKNRGKVDKR